MKDIVRELFKFLKQDPKSGLSMLRWLVLGIFLLVVMEALDLAQLIVGGG